MAEDEIAMAVREAKSRGKRVPANARSDQSVRYCLQYGIEIIYHASFGGDRTIDEPALGDDEFFVAPGWPGCATPATTRVPMGCQRRSRGQMGYHAEYERAIETKGKMKQAGIRVLPGGDYGFAWTPHGTNANDPEHFVDLLGFTPMEAIVAATRLGGEIMGRPNELGQVKPGFLADLILVDGDPIADIRVLQKRDRILAVMKDGRFHREMAGRRATNGIRG
ncbi:MAG: amidohydrolase family protein [Burkholderiaceae bacterium]